MQDLALVKLVLLGLQIASLRLLHLDESNLSYVIMPSFCPEAALKCGVLFHQFLRPYFYTLCKQCFARKPPATATITQALLEAFAVMGSKSSAVGFWCAIL